MSLRGIRSSQYYSTIQAYFLTYFPNCKAESKKPHTNPTLSEAKLLIARIIDWTFEDSTAHGKLLSWENIDGLEALLS